MTLRATGDPGAAGGDVTTVDAAVLILLGALLPSSAHDTELILVSMLYLALALALFVRRRRDLGNLLGDGLRTPHSELVGDSP